MTVVFNKDRAIAKKKELEVSDPTTAKEQIFDVFFLLRSIF
jgi:hypothetical protein